MEQIQQKNNELKDLFKEELALQKTLLEKFKLYDVDQIMEKESKIFSEMAEQDIAVFLKVSEKLMMIQDKLWNKYKMDTRNYHNTH